MIYLKTSTGLNQYMYGIEFRAAFSLREKFPALVFSHRGAESAVVADLSN